jgi:hypothetical protein
MSESNREDVQSLEILADIIKSFFLFAMTFILCENPLFIQEYVLGFFKRNSVLGLVLQVFEFVPFESCLDHFIILQSMAN